MLNITPNANKKLDSVGTLIIDIKTTGCNGYSYVYTPIKSIDSQKFDDLGPIKVGPSVYFSKKLHELIWDKINILDYRIDQFLSQFELKSSISDSYCGCGHSFSVKNEE